MPKTEERVEDRLADFTRDRRILLLSGMALIIGSLSAVVAKILVVLIAIFTNLTFYQRFSIEFVSPANHHLGKLVILAPVVGGLVIGLMARYGSEKIRGHGIPEALEAILFGRSRMEAKVAVLKPVSSAISIGTGGPFGAEGPIIMTGGAVGSLFAQMFHLSAAERKTLLVAGAAGGMSAIFNSPVAAVLLAVELLLFEWRPRSFIPVAIASAVAAVIRVPLLGRGAIFPTQLHSPLGAEGLTIAFIVGISAGLASGLLTAIVYACEDLFGKLPIHWMWWPAIGGLFVGVGGWLDPRVLGVGYDTIHSLLKGEMIGAAVIGLLIGKALVWSISLGSGTSGGVLAPLLIMGGALGAMEARWIPIGYPGLWAALSMGAMMGGTMRSPFTAVAFMVELTHDVNVLPGLLVACVAADALTVLLMKRSILTEKVARRGYHVTRECIANPPHLLRVQDVMEPPVLQVGDRPPAVSYPDELLDHALTKMLEHEVDLLPVVNRGEPEQVVGYVARDGILAAWVQFARDEGRREPGWLAARFRKVRDRPAS